MRVGALMLLSLFGVAAASAAPIYQSVSLAIIDTCGCEIDAPPGAQEIDYSSDDGFWQFSAVLKTNLAGDPTGTPFDKNLIVRFTDFTLTCTDTNAITNPTVRPRGGCPDVAVGFLFEADFDYLPDQIQYGVQIDGTGTPNANAGGALSGDINGKLLQDSNDMFSFSHFGVLTPSVPGSLFVSGIVGIKKIAGTGPIPIGTQISFPDSIAFGFQAPAPEPAAIPVLGAGLGLVAWRLRRRNR